MRLNQVANQLKIAPDTIQAAIAQLHQQNPQLFPTASISDFNEAQVKAIAQHLANPQQEQGSGQSGGPGAIHELEQKYAQAGQVVGARLAEVLITSADNSATHLLLQASIADVYGVNDQLGKGRIDQSAAATLAEALGNLGKPQAVTVVNLDFARPNTLLQLAGMQPSTPPALSASNSAATNEAGSDS